MDYLALLPPNVHEEIASRLHFEECFNFGGYHQGLVWIIKKYKNKQVNDFIVDCGYNNPQEKIYLPVSDFVLTNDNKFSVNIKKKSFLFSGNCQLLILKSESQRIIFLDRELNDKLFDILKNNLKCDYCQEGFDIDFVDGKIKANNYVFNPTNYTCHGKKCTNFGSLPKLFKKCHKSCKLDCDKCHGILCPNCVVICEFCNLKICKKRACACSQRCPGWDICGNKICRDTPSSYLEIFHIGPKSAFNLYYCRECGDQCSLCNEFFKNDDLKICICGKKYCVKNVCKNEHQVCYYVKCGNCSGSYPSKNLVVCPDCDTKLCENCRIKCHCDDNNCVGYACKNCSYPISITVYKRKNK